MALSVGSLIAFLKGDTKHFEKSLKTAERKAKEFADNFEHIGKAAAGVAVGLGVLGGAALKVAADFKEVQSAAEVVFGSSAAAASIEKWAADAGAAMGRSQVQMMRFATQAQMLIDPMVGNKEAAAKMSKQVAQLAVDIGSMNNVSDADALTALRSGISGESEPLKRFGIVMNETNLKAFALSKGLSGNVKDMTEAGKTALRLAFIMDKTKNSQGDAARTIDSFSNQVKVARGSVEDLANKLGRALEPAANAVLHSINKLFGWLKSVDQSTIQWTVGIGAVVFGLSSLIASLVGFAALVPTLIKIFKSASLGFSLMTSGALKASAAVYTFASTSVAALWSFAVSAATAVRTFAVSAAVAMRSFAVSAASMTMQAARAVVATTWMMAAQAGAAIWRFPDVLLGYMRAFAVGSIAAVRSFVTAGIPAIFSFVGASLTALQAWAISSLAAVRTFVVNAASALVAFAVSGLASLRTFVVGGIAAGGSFLTGVLPAIQSFAVQGLASIRTFVVGGVTSFAQFAVKGAAAMLAFAKAAVLALGPILLKLAILGALVGAVILIAVALKKAWDSNLGGIQDKVEAVRAFFGKAWDWIKDKSKSLGEMLGTIATGMKDRFIDAIAVVLRGVAKLAAGLEKLGLFEDGQISGFLNNAAKSAEQLKGTEGNAKIAEAAEVAWDGVKDHAGKVMDSVGVAMNSAATSMAAAFNQGMAQVKDFLGLNFEMPDALATPKMDNADLLALAKQGDAAAKAAKTVKAPAMTFEAAEITGKDQSGGVAGFAAGMIGDAVKSGVKGLSNVIEGAMQGAQIGGPIGAVVGALLGALLQSEEFMSLLEMAGAVIGTVGELLTSLVPAVQPLLGALQILLSSAFTTLAPYFEFLAILTEPLAGVLVALAAVFAAFAPAMKMFSGLMMMVAMLLTAQLIPVIGVMFEAFKWVGIGMLELAKMIAPLWNGVINAISGALRSIANFSFEIAGATIKPFAALGGWADSLDKAKLSVEGLQEQQDKLREMTFASAVEQAKLAAATADQTEAVKAANEAFSNVPTGLKLVEHRFMSIAKDAADAERYQVDSVKTSQQGIKATEGVTKFAAGGLVTRRIDNATVGEAGPEAIIPLDRMAELGFGGGGGNQYHFHGITDPEAVYRKVKELQRRDNYRKTGNSLRG